MKKSERYFFVLLLAFFLTAGLSLQSEAAAKLAKTKLILKTGNAYVLSLTGNKKAVEWSSSKPKVAEIVSSDKNQAVLRAKKAGTSKITAKIGKKTLTCKVTVRKNAAMPKKLTLIVGDKFTFSQTEKASWAVSKASLGTLRTKNSGKTGVLTAKRPGTVRVTATVRDMVILCRVTILTPDGKKKAGAGQDQTKAPDQGTDLEKDTHQGDANKDPGTENDSEITTNIRQVTFVKTGMVSMASLLNTEEAVTWKSADKTIATVDETGKIKAVGAGETTVYTKLNGKKYSINVIVRPCTLKKKKVVVRQTKEITDREEAIGLRLWWADTGEEITGLEWFTANKKIATVSKDAADKDIWKIHPKKNGTTEIYCKYLGGQFTIDLTVDMEE